MDQIRRRILEGERIPHDEKVFSLFEPHTEWISKGKAGVPVELGLRVCVMAAPDGFILHHRVMERCTDDAVAVPMVQETRDRFPLVRAVSMDKGFHSPSNQTELRQIVGTVVLPKKGRRTQEEAERERDPEFATLRRQHAAVESAINALEVHGLDRCRDHGIDGFRRYVGLAVLARNIQHLGAILRRQERDAEKRRRGPYRKAA
ncbi:transposase [Thioalkalivibrio paradoxus ARh 1]|uniref:Transposase n=1 Tax=Thioalkalivibrio paradoxus ARh 1 TaxID=713585 RepID=W0DP07_9GAMM|nr:transposase [Thioalkalivibrio paradoxus ARh 1]